MDSSLSFDIDSIKQSYERSQVQQDTKKKFFVRFYELFLASDPEIRAMFMQTNIMKQVNALKNGINMVIMFSENRDNPVAQKAMENIKLTHNSDTLKVRQRHFDIWEDCLINTLKEYDSEFDHSLEHQWRVLVKQTVDFLLD